MSRKYHTFEECKDLYKNSVFPEMYNIDPNNDEEIEREINHTFEALKENFKDTDKTDEEIVDLVYRSIFNADRNNKLRRIEKMRNNPTPLFQQIPSYGTVYGHECQPKPFDPELRDLYGAAYNNNSFDQKEISFYGKFSTIKMILMSGEEYYICTNNENVVYESSTFETDALYPTSDLLMHMGDIFKFVESYNDKSEDKVKCVLKIGVNINPSKNNINRIYEKEN